MWQELKKLIKEQSSFILTTHINPDGDGIGSACALLELLLEVGKKARFVSPDPIPPRFLFLDKHNLFEEYSKQGNYSQTDVLIVLDAHKKERIGRVQDLLDLHNVTTVVIDHHPESISIGDINLIDEIGSERDAIDWIKNETNIEDNIKIINISEDSKIIKLLNFFPFKDIIVKNISFSNGLYAIWAPSL